jgi:aryl-phospho-beta-D-glucosidase BglC (GH1 family)
MIYSTLSVFQSAGNSSPKAKQLPINWIRPIWLNMTCEYLNRISLKKQPNRFCSLVQQCLLTGSYCIIDIHNYARFGQYYFEKAYITSTNTEIGGGIIGQGGPGNAMFAALWSSIATKYKGQGKVIFGLMNEPHDSSCSQFLFGNKKLISLSTQHRKVGRNLPSCCNSNCK